MMHLITIIPSSQHKHISKPYHVTTSIVKMVKTRILIRKTVPLRILVLAIASLFFLVLFIFGGFKYVSLEHIRDQATRKVELVTMFGGLALLILGLTLMADLALGWTERLQQPDAMDYNDGLTSKTEIEAPMEAKATCRIIRTIIRMLGTAIAMCMLIWIIYSGFRLATEPSIDSRYRHLVFAIGVISIAFGVIYFIIGLAIGRELALDLKNRFRIRRKGNWNSRNQQLC